MTWKFKKTRDFEKQRMFEDIERDICTEAYTYKKRGIMTGTDEDLYWDDAHFGEISE